jgi:hypothetical protein
MKFLDDLNDIVYYSYLNEKYVDFQTILYLTNTEKTFMWRYLNKLEIPFLDYQNRRLYKFNDILNSVELMDILDINKLGI